MFYKNKKRVLIITYEFPPMGGIGSIWIAKYVKYLPEFGWEPVIVTVKDVPTNFPDGSIDDDLPPNLRVYRSFSLEPTRLVRLLRRAKSPSASRSRDRGGDKVVYSYTGLPLGVLAKIRLLFIPDEKIGWFFFALLSSLRAIRENRPSVVSSTGPPYTANFIGMACAAITGLPWVCEFKDPWIDNPQEASVNPVNRRVFIALEKAMLRRANAVICAMPGQVEGFERRYGEGFVKRCHIITNGFDAEDFVGETGLEEKFTITFVGKVYGGRYPQALLKAVKILLEEGKIDAEDIRIRYVGTLDVESRALFAAEDIAGVIELTGFVDHSTCIKLMRSSHLLLLQLADGEMSRIIYTGKMFEYFGARRPILALVGEGATAKLIGEMGAGTVVNPDSIEGICQAVMHYYSMYKAGEDFYIDNPELARFDRRKQAENLAAVFNEISRD
ncbi:MAG: glycosyltransferase [Actinomycetota bacterium]|nr:glycosyltransferase [Actinomycetota bacterium]